MKLISYLRVSTQRQGVSGLGLAAQQQAIDAYTSRVGGEVVATYTDVESGKRNDRVQLESAIKRCRLTGSTLLIAKLDRLSRNKAFLFKLMESKIKFICADMPEANELTISFMALIADHEGKVISERTKAALQAAKARGVKLGNTANLTNRDTTAANKTRLDKSYKRNGELLEVIDAMTAEYGELSLRTMAEKLNDAGYTTARGKRWQANSVRRVIRSRTAETKQVAA